ncbi:thioesterase domain-containing protein [Streptomyces sp. NPDC052101]|uniref:thioesterase II family protein n=1 Tax=Streptomyces sp. NPDC052101 TaxID=3155763 RepID=UPI003425F459
MTEPNPCLPHPPTGEAPLRLFCFHHAGGSAGAFRGWPDLLGPGIEIVPVQLPGREGRIREPRHTRLDPLVEEVSAALDGLLDEPYLFYGHSMGTLLAHEITARLPAGARLPELLIVGGFPAPHLGHALNLPPGLADAELTTLLLGLGGLPAELADRPEWLEVLLPIVRDDLAVCADHRPAPPEPLPVPIHALAGQDDLLVDVDKVLAWQRHTSVSFRAESLPGGHFFAKDHPSAFFTALTWAIRARLPHGPDPVRAAR